MLIIYLKIFYWEINNSKWLFTLITVNTLLRYINTLIYQQDIY